MAIREPVLVQRRECANGKEGRLVVLFVSREIF